MPKQSQYLLASIVESSQDSIVTIDLNRVITSWNKGAEELYGYTAEEVIGRPLALVMVPKDIQGLIDKVQDIVDEITVPIYETVRLHKNGKQAELEILLSPVRNGLGEVIGVSTVARDISIRKMQERQKDDFISIASHELKTPVTNIKSYAELILEKLQQSGDEKTAWMMTKLNTQVDKLIELIKTLLDTTRLTAGEILLTLEAFDLNGLINEQIETFSLVQENHRFIFNAGEIKPVHADRKLIGQVLTNILTNAAKYSPKGGDIIVTTRDKGDEVEVSVQDFGIGIPANVKEKIFERYFRVSDPQVASVSGIGLGLFISAGIIRQHGGNISLESEEGKGSTFSFTLPYRNV